jgi:hypothetical protein
VVRSCRALKVISTKSTRRCRTSASGASRVCWKVLIGFGGPERLAELADELNFAIDDLLPLRGGPQPAGDRDRLDPLRRLFDYDRDDAEFTLEPGAEQYL